MRKIYSFITFIIASIQILHASNMSVDVDGIWYFLHSTDSTAIVTFRGWTPIGDSYTGDIVVPSYVTYEDITYKVTSIGNSAFRGCDGLISVIIPNTVTSIGEAAFFECHNLVSVQIPNSVTSIAAMAFWRCTSLAYVRIPEGHINFSGEFIFADCNLISIKIHEGVTKLPYAIFGRNKHLTAVDLPSTINNMEAAIFQNCPSLKTIINRATEPLSSGNAVFHNLNKSYCTLYVPAESVELYKTANLWKDFKQILPISQAIEDSINFDKPQFSVTTLSSNQEWGLTFGDTTAYYLDTITINANSNYGYHFVHWRDGESQNQRDVLLIKDTMYEAVFDKNSYEIKPYVSPVGSGEITGHSLALYLDTVSLNAKSNYGYHFVQWSDGINDNPRTFILTQDTVFTAKFEKNPTILYNYDSNIGSIIGDTILADKAEGYITFLAKPNNGYHFVQWADGNKDNPRTIYLTQDTVFTAEFAQNPANHFTLITISDNPERGYTLGDTIAPAGSKVPISAVSNYGYYFSIWSDGYHKRERSIFLNENITITAYFEKNDYFIETIVDSAMGSILCVEQAQYLDTIEMAAIPKHGFRFAQWADGIINNPRTFILTKDTTFTAEFVGNNILFVQFFGYNAELLDRQFVEYGTSAVAPVAPEVYLYDFVGWDKDFSCIQTDLNIYAIYVPSKEDFDYVGREEIYHSKYLRDGQLFILRGDKTYTVTGQEIK